MPYKSKKKDLQQVAVAERLPSDVSSCLGVAQGVAVPFCNTDYTDSLSMLQDVLNDKFTLQKNNSLYLSSVYRYLGEYLLADRVGSCGSFLEFHYDQNDIHLAKANFCRDRLCPMCSWRKSLKMFGQVSKIMNVLQSEGYVFLFLTLTIRNVSADDLSSSLDLMNSGWRYLVHKNSRFKNAVAGTMRTIEITRNSFTGFYHPHYHAILAVKPEYFSDFYISQSDWVSLWRNACKLDYDPSVHIQRVFSMSDPLDMCHAVAEVTKYALKSADYLTGNIDIDKEIVSTLRKSLYHRRLSSYTGCFYKVSSALNLPDPENISLDDSDELRSDVAYMVIKFHWKNGCYLEVK